MEGWSPRGMLAAICREVDGTEPRTASGCKDRLIDAFSRSRRMVLVDEADRLKRVEMIEHLRDVHDLTGAPIALIGEEHLHAMISGRRRLWSRVTQSVVFGPITVEDIILFAGKAAALKMQPDAAGEVAKRSGGDFRLIYLDVRDLERMGRTSKTSEVTVDMVRALSHRRPGPVMSGRRG
jgi:DNA transposition AAA+ family ATPase